MFEPDGPTEGMFEPDGLTEGMFEPDGPTEGVGDIPGLNTAPGSPHPKEIIIGAIKKE